MLSTRPALLGPALAEDEPGLSSRNGLLACDALAIMPVLGLPAVLGDEFPCILPGYEGALASVVDPASLRYQTLYQGAWKAWWSLAEVYASRMAGRIVTLRAGATHHRWWQRLRLEAELMHVERCELALPRRLSPAAMRLAQGFALAQALSEHRHGPGPITYSRRFAMDWCGLPERATGAGIRELVDATVLTPAGAIDRPGRRPTPLYTLSPDVVAAGPSLTPSEAALA